MRNAFIDELIELATINEKIVLIVGDLGFSVIEPFAEKFPDRFINAGVAEQNMMGLAAGMASEGFHPFVYSIANFPLFRCAEQIRNDVDYHQFPVTIVSVGGGLAYGNFGYSHHAVQDFGLIRMMPNMMIAAPGDPMEVRACMRYLVEYPQPSYLRLGRAGEPNYHSTIPQVAPGKWLTISSNSENKKCFLTTGTGLDIAKKWLVSKQYTDYSLYSMPLWSMNSKQNQLEFAQNWELISTVEEHLIDCGFGSWFSEALNQYELKLPVVKHIGLDPIVCGMVGTQSTLVKAGGLLPGEEE